MNNKLVFFRQICIVISVLAILTIYPAQVKSQISHGGTPKSLSNEKGIAGTSAISYDEVFLTPPDVEQLRGEDIQSGKDGTPPRVGISIPFCASKSTAGTWTELPDGGRLWTLKITSPGATALSVFFDSWHLAPGCSMFLYNENRKHVIGSFTHENNLDNGTFATEMVQGESIYIEYYEPKLMRGTSDFNIASVGYFYEKLAGLSKYEDSPKTVGASGTCQVNVNCSPEGDDWQDEKRGVAQITFLAGGSWYLCTGTLVNNTANDGTPYFLTAFHCGAADASASELNQWVFKFRYEATDCDNPGSEPTTYSITGCTSKAMGDISGGSDFFLVLLNSTPTVTHQPYYNGWNRNDLASFSNGVGIHHPSGDIKKISYYSTATRTGNVNIGGSIMAANACWQTTWTETDNGYGCTEGGSSGSPQFSSTGLQIGTLSGGSSECGGSEAGPDYYGRFWYHWDQNGTADDERLKPWLDPVPTGATTLAGYDPFASQPPVVDFYAVPTTILQGSSVDFYNLTENSPLSYDWTFEGGTPGSSTETNPTDIVYNTIGTFDVTLESTNGNGTGDLTKTDYINVVDPSSSFCDTVSQFCCSYVIYTTAEGYVCGTNEYDMTQWAEKYESYSPYNQVNGARFYIADADNATSPDVTFNMYNISGGNPGTVIASKTVSLASIVTAFNDDGYIDINFDTPVDIPPGGFFLGYERPGTPASGDTLALVSNGEDGSISTAYTYYDGSWYLSSNLWSEMGNFQHAIFPFVCYIGTLPPVADFIGVPDRVELGGTVQFTDNSGGTTPTSWSWTFEGGDPPTSTDQNPLVTYSTLGVYDVTLEVENTNGTSDTTKVEYIEVYDPNGTTAFTLDFEACTDFQLDDFDPWTTNDQDGSAVYGVNDFDFTNEGYTAGSFIAFNSHSTTPEATGWEAHGGNLCGICFAATTPTNDDWLISTQISLGDNSSFSFWTKSITDEYGLERFIVLVSTTDNLPASFSAISAGSYIEAPVTWTEYNYDLSAYDNQTVYVAIQCVSDDAFAFMIDDIEIYSEYQPPVCDFNADQTNVPLGTTVNFTDLSTNMPTEWSWSFSGGVPATSTDQNPSIQYNTLGTYPVSLTVTNAEGSDDETKTGYITVTPVPDVIVEWNFPNNPDNNTADAGLAVNLTKTITPFGGVSDITYAADGVTTYSVDGETWANGMDLKGWQIDFETTGYGTLKLSYAQMSSDSRSPRDFKIQYSTDGSTWIDLGVDITLVEDVWYQENNISLPAACENQANVYLRWIMTSNTGCGGGTVSSNLSTRRNAMDNIVVTGLPMSTPPVADFSANDTEICEGESVTFTDESTNTPTSWAWTFESGTPAISSDPNPVITYNTAGTYQVELIATNGSGSDTETKIGYITVNPVAVAPTSVNASLTEICEGESTTLSYTGGTGDTFNWYSASCGGTAEGTGQDLIVSPTGTTTYYGTWENSCGESTCEQVTVTVNPLPVAPSSVTATDLTICNGESTTLSYTGGSGTTFAWYTVSCGGTPAGTGNDLIVSPTVTTTYYGRWENSCGESSCEEVTVTVNALPVVPSSVTASDLTICNGESTTLSYTDGSGTTFAWYTGSCGGTAAGAGNDLSVSPTVTTTYYGRWENSCGETSCEEVTITVNPVAVTPTSVSATDLSICNGESTFLTYTGGSGDTFNWYTGSCGDVLVGSGNNLEVNPTANTTYYGAWETSCGLSICKTVAITVTQLPVDPVSVSATDTEICSGESTELSYTGGSGTTFRWYTESCGGTIAGTGNNLTVFPTVNTTYYGRWENTCGESGCKTVSITVNPVAVAPTSVTATDTDICDGESTFLTYTGGSGDTFNWYTGSCGGTLIGTGDNFEVNPATTITYYGAWETSCGLSACKTVAITVTPLPEDPTSVAATDTDICEGENTTLSYTGGSGTTFAWYTESCGGTPAGTGNNLIVSPTVTTTYYGRWETSCGNSVCETVLITVHESPDAPVVDVDCSGGPDFAVITVTSPIGIEYEYSLSGGTFQASPVFTNISNGTYYIDVEADGCTTTGTNFNVSCGCANPTELTLSETAATTCGTADYSVTNNTFGGSAISVTLIHDGSGSLDQTTFATTPFDFTYTPDIADVGNTVTITVTTDNPLGAPCLAAQETFVLTVNALPTDPVSVSSTETDICNGESVTLSYTGGSGTTFSWYSTSCGVDLVGTGQDLTVFPTSTTTYYGRWENSCGESGCKEVTVTVNPLPVAPTSVTATDITICNGESTTLSYTDGSGTTFAWYTGSCGGDIAGTGNDLVVNPTGTTTYYGRWETICGNSDCETVTITVNPLPVAPSVIDATETIICDGESTTLSYTGGSGIVFKWYTDDCGITEVGEGNDFIVSPSVTTTYFGRWENGCGYSDCENITITVNQIATAPTSVEATNTEICNGESTELSYTGGSGDVFNWYTGSCNGTIVGTGNNIIVSPETTTTYYGNWTGICNNSDCESVTIVVNALPVEPSSVQATETTICEGESTTLSYTGGNGITFNWYTESCGGISAGTGNDLLVSPSITTTYYGRWENPCGASICKEVTIIVNLTSVEPTIVGADNNTICSGETAHLMYVGGNGEVFKWYTGACGDTEAGEGNNLAVSPTVTTTYYGRWESTCGNSVCKSVTITVNNAPIAPDVITADNTSVCLGESVMLSFTGGNGDTFVWYTGACGDTEIGSGNILFAAPTEETTYYGRWENSCGVSDCESVVVSVNELPETPVAEYECNGTGGAAIITVISPVGPGYTYSLNAVTFQEETVFSNIPDGDYAVTVSYNGCTTTGDVFGFDCLCDNPPSLTLSPTDGIICDNEPVFVLSGNTFSGATEITISHTGTGTLEQETITSSPFDIVYTMGEEDYDNQVMITVTTNNPIGDPCSADIGSFTILPIAAPVLDLPESVNACAEEIFEYTLTEPYDYILWSNDSEDPTYSATYIYEGDYSVWVTVGNNYCESVDTMTVVVTICSDITNSINSGEFSLYPNPTNSNITLNINDYEGDITYTFFDINGKEIATNKIFVDNEYKEEISLQDCVPGMYYIRLTTTDETINYKIIKN